MPNLQSSLIRLLLVLPVALALIAELRAAGPEVKTLFPSGGQRGTTVELKASGNFPVWPVQCWVDHPGVSLSPAADKGKLNAVIAPDARPGLCWIRLYDRSGAASLQPFVIGMHPEVTEQDPNNSFKEAQLLNGETTIVNGRLNPSNDVDMFTVELKKGQTMVASLVAHERLESPVDAVLQVVSSRGTVLAYNHDHVGLDPQVAFVAPADGRYAIRVFGFPSTPNSTIGFSGSDRHLYRLTVTTGPFVDYVWPLSVTRNRETPIELFGWNIPDLMKRMLANAGEDQFDLIDPRIANIVPLGVESNAVPVEVEPNGPGHEQSVELPVTISGRIDPLGDVDVFSFAAKQGQPLLFQLESRSLGYPVDGVLEITDTMGKSLARVDDVGSSRDAVIEFAPPADGTYRIAVSDLTRQGSARHVYRLRARAAEPDFEVTADAETYTLVAGKPVEVTLSINRLRSFDEAIEWKVEELPEGVTVAATASTPTGDAAKSVKLTLTTTGGASSGPVRIVGTSTGARKLSRTASIPIAGRTARTASAWLTVLPNDGK